MVETTIPCLIGQLDTGTDLNILITHILDHNQKRRLATLDTTLDIHQAGTVLDINNCWLRLFRAGSWPGRLGGLSRSSLLTPDRWGQQAATQQEKLRVLIIMVMVIIPPQPLSNLLRSLHQNNVSKKAA